MKKNSRSKNRRQQTSKGLPLGADGGRNEAWNEAMMEKGRSSAASRHKSAKDYRRKPKHVGRGWE